ncbi:uncharacterized protein LOC125496617 [Beta vulgaris subsp. vulgaris]|uniref:uncharacterized protein LOC125496617 n=1 Tax=Beta vulgaris subsp. vulgaris TaxID=3555 RepID=UPI0020367948|nr:uncharacterized protein LOC125496617 [Beta vulgaris subsp. vulgaris]
MPSVAFTSEDARGIIYPHDDPLVVSLQISTTMVYRVLVDGGSSANILYKETFERMGLETACLKPTSYPVIGFTGAFVPEGNVKLAVKLGEGFHSRDMMVEFLVVDILAAYNAIIGRPLIHDAQAVVSTYQLTMINTSNDGKPEKIRGNQESARACYLTALKHSDHKCPAETLPSKRKRRRTGNKDKKDLSMKNFEGRPTDQPLPSPEGETEEVSLELERPERTMKIGAELAAEVQINLITLLRDHADIFAFYADEMLGIDPAFMVHRLNVNKDVRQVKQKKRNFSGEKNATIKKEVDKLLAADFIEPSDYPEWLANGVMVKKANGSWRMCMDFTDLNKACPKDFYPLPRVDQLVDSTSGHALLSFMDDFSGYHQISLLESDRDTTTFITDA